MSDQDPVWLSKFYTPSEDMPPQYRSAQFEERLTHIQFNYAGAILGQYEDIARMADKVRGIIDQLYHSDEPVEERIAVFNELKAVLQKRRSDDGEDWYTECPSIWYASPLATIIDSNMTHIDLAVCRLGTEHSIKTGWDIII